MGVKSFYDCPDCYDELMQILASKQNTERAIKTMEVLSFMDKFEQNDE